MKKILLFRSGALGDTIITFPLLEFLKKNSYEIHFVGNSEYLSIIDFFDLGKTLSFDHPMFLPLFMENNNKINSLRDYIKKFNYIFCIEKQETLYHQVRNLNNQSFYIKSHPEMFVPLRIYLVREVSKILEIPFSYEVKSYMQTLKEPILIHPGAGSKSKMWEVENFLQVIDFLLKRFKNITILEGPAEKGIKNKFSDVSQSLNFETVNNVISLINIIKRHNFYIGNDSGITHLASYLGISGIAIFGSTNPWLWSPLPNISCLYDIKNFEIIFPSYKFVISFLEDLL